MVPSVLTLGEGKASFSAIESESPIGHFEDSHNPYEISGSNQQLTTTSGFTDTTPRSIQSPNTTGNITQGFPPILTIMPTAVVHAVSRGCSTAAVCITETHKRTLDLFSSFAGFLLRPLTTEISSGRRTSLNITGLVEGGVPEIVILGRSYRLDREEEKESFLEDFCSRITFTYRRNFVPIDAIPCTDINSPQLSWRETAKPVDQLGLRSNKCLTNVSKSDEDKNHINVIEHQEQTQFRNSSRSNDMLIPRNSSPTFSNDSHQSSIPSATFSLKSQGIHLDDTSVPTLSPVSVPFFQRVLSRNRIGQIISDAGWGCMIRATQMAVAQSLLFLRLGRDWRRRKRRRNKSKEIVVVTAAEAINHDLSMNNDAAAATSLSTCFRCPEDSGSVVNSKIIDEHTSSVKQSFTLKFTPPSLSQQLTHSALRSTPQFTELISLFADHPDFPLSIHSIARLAQTIYGIPIGRWLGPTSCAQAVASLMTSPQFISKFPDIKPIVFPDGLLIHSAVKDVLQPPTDNANDLSPRSALIVLCMKLGADCFNAKRYRTPIARCFRLCQFQGLAGGGSLTSAHFFFGICARGLLYLDPHAAIQPSFLPPPNPALSFNSCSSPNLSHGISTPLDHDIRENGVQSYLYSSINRHSHSILENSSDSFPDHKMTNRSTENQDTKISSRSISPSYLQSSSKFCDDEYENFILPSELQFFPLIEQSNHPYPSILPWSSINPSMALYFLCRGFDDYRSLVDSLKSFSTDVPELFEMSETPLDFSRAANMDLDQFSLEDD